MKILNQLITEKAEAESNNISCSHAVKSVLSNNIDNHHRIHQSGNDIKNESTMIKYLSYESRRY